MLEPLPRSSVNLHDAYFQKKVNANRACLLALCSEDLLQNFYFEAGLCSSDEPLLGNREAPETILVEDGERAGGHGSGG